MNGKQAKKLRRLAEKQTIGQEKVIYLGQARIKKTFMEKVWYVLGIKRLNPLSTRGRYQQLKREYKSSPSS